MPPPISTLLQHHNGQLAEYDFLLARLRETLTSGIHTDNTFIPPQPFSPLAREYEKGESHIARLVQGIGGRTRTDGLLSLTQTLKYYGLIVAQPQSIATLTAVIRELEERSAIHRLRLEGGIDLGQLLSADDQQKIIDEIGQVLGDEETPIIDRLAREADPQVTVEQLRATPTAGVERLLDSHKARYLSKRLFDVLGWYGARSDEEPAPGAGIRLLAEALRIWYRPSPEEPAGTIAGYRLQQNSNHGKSYQRIRSEFEDHLLDSGRVTTAIEKIVLGRLLLRQFPIEFQVRDVPADIPYATSIVWVNFVHGVNLVQELDPGLLQRMTFQQLVDFPLRKSEKASDALLDLIALTRAPAAKEWALATGSIAPGDANPAHILSRSITALEKYTKQLTSAITQIDVKLPQRLELAKHQVNKVSTGSLIDPLALKLMRDDGYAGNRSKRNIIDTPTIPGKTYPFLEVYASGGLTPNTKWYVSKDGKSRDQWVSLSEDRILKSGFSKPHDRRFTLIPNLSLPNISTLFDGQFNSQLDKARVAYETLIKSLLVTLPWVDRRALEHGEVRVYTLRNETSNIAADNETAEMTMPLRARMGFVLQANYQGTVTWYECVPRASILRPRHDIPAHKVGGVRKLFNTEPDFFNNQTTVVGIRGALIPFDWAAHNTGSLPKRNATCHAILDQLGSTLNHLPIPPAHHDIYSNLTLLSPRTQQIATFISTNLFYLDEKELRASAWGETEFERDRDKEHWIYNLKPFVPFWGSIDDLKSDNFGDRLLGVIGLIVDVVSFAVPLGKFAAGSIRLATQAGRVGIRVTIPSMAKLSSKLLTSSLRNLNPLDAIPGLLRSTTRGIRTASRAAVHLERKAMFKLRKLAGRADEYDFAHGLPQVTEPGLWKPLIEADQLAMVKGIDDVPVRNVASSGSRHYLIDPLSSRPYGPLLTSHSGDLSLGRSGYGPLTKTDAHFVVELPENTRIREVLEIDGRTTVFIDDLPYRLDGDELRRADLMDDPYKTIPCRIRRVPGSDLCKTSYVLRDSAPTPDTGSFDNAKGWAPWFGDITYTPATNRAAMQISSLRAHSTLNATMEFQKGIYGRVMVSIPVAGQELVDTFHTGATIVEAIDGSKHYVFMRLNAADFYVAERAKDQSVYDSLTFRKADTLPVELKGELAVVYTGSLNANNMVRIHGQESVERALRAMDEIAVPIGGHTSPPDTLKFLKVDTSAAEAVLFDHSTRMIVRSSTDGASTWSLSKAAPHSVRETTAEIFNNLFGKKAITVGASVEGGPKALKIDGTMMDLQRLISRKKGHPVRGPRNIAFAEIKTKAGVREVYVSVSGQQGDTGFLPLFAKAGTTNEVKIDSISYFNIDHKTYFTSTALEVTPQGRLHAIPHTIDNIETYTPALTSRPTSLDTESKLISVIRGKYPDPKEIDSITIATTMAPCDSCSVVMKQFAYDGNPNALDVIWK